MIRSTGAVRRRTLALALETSVLAAGMAFPVAAYAQCAPDPTLANGTTTCTGTDADGIRVTTGGTVLTVASGAAVTNAGAPAITISVPHGIAGSFSNTVNVLGSVSAAGQDAIAAMSGSVPANPGFSGQQVTLTVGGGASVAGATALSLLQTAGNAFGTVAATVDNAGTLTGTSGIALRGIAVSTANGSTSPLTSFAGITNRAGGVISGSIVGAVSSLGNAGSIDGGAGSAIDSSLPSSPNLTNSAGGTIRSASAAATILAGSSYALFVNNGGTIANAGSGPALAGGALYVTNVAGGRIGSAGSTAITAATSLNLTNLGVVTGSVVTGNGASMVDSTVGTINGSLSFGGGNDTLLVRYAGARKLATGVTGTVTAGGGTNTERVIFAGDTSVTTPIDLDAGFQQLVLAPAAKVTATLQPGFSTAAGLVLSGAGTVVNRATIALAGPAVTDLDYAFGSAAAFRNEGLITAGAGNSAGLTLMNHSFTNSGSITVTGGTGVSMSYNPVINSGTITASGNGVTVSDGDLTNSGTIVSTGGTGVTLFGNVGYTGSNSGTIRGATSGVTTGLPITNTGTIASAGTAVVLQPYGSLLNAAGGVVNGGSGGAVTAFAFNSTVANAGTINGNVTFTSGDNSLVYVALAGGTLYGNLALSGGTLVTDLINTGTGQFAGIAGTVSASSGAALRYAVNSDAAATLPASGVAPFTTTGYQVANGAKLTLTAPATQTRTQTLLLAGNGSVDLSANLAVSNATAIQSTSTIGYAGAPGTTAALAITSRGTIAVTRPAGLTTADIVAGASLSSTDSFTNAGTINVTDRTGVPSAFGISGGSVTNAGTILLDGAVGTTGSRVVNTGSILQASGGATSFGVTSTTMLDNRGTIRVGAAAVTLGSGGMLTNSGTLASSIGAAVIGTDVTSTATIVNAAGGVISGAAGTAVRLFSGSFTNAGTVNGTVDLGYYLPTFTTVPQRSSASSTYIAAGGTIAGDLRFGDGADLFLVQGGTLGVTGTIDGGGGTDIFGRGLSSSGTVSIDLVGVRNFEDALVRASGADTVVTATATGRFAGNLYAVGTGSVVNQASVAGMLSTSLPYVSSVPFPSGEALLSLTNAGTVAGGVFATVPVFANSGAVGSASLAGTGVQVSDNTPFSFTNSGSVTTGVTNSSYYYPTVQLYGTGSATIANSGQISGAGLAATLGANLNDSAASLAFANSGAITSSGADGVSLLLLGASNTGGSGNSGGTIQIVNSGTISSRRDPVSAAGYAQGLDLEIFGTNQPVAYSIANSGTISAVDTLRTVVPLRQVVGVLVEGAPGVSGTITNAAGGVISASGGRAYALIAADHALNLANAGTISAIGTAASVAILTFDAYANSIRNTGAITGDIVLADGADTVDNAGTIMGKVTLGAGDDMFVQRVGGTVSGLVDGGDGTDGYIVDTTGGTATLAAAAIANFERVTQTGTGTGSYSGGFGVDTINLAGGTLSVTGGQTLATTGATTVTGAVGGTSLAVVNAGTIAGGIAFADGNDMVVNTGSIAGRVQFGAGDDTYVEGVGSQVPGGGVDGGGGTNLYRVVLAGNRTGIGARANFQNLAVDGTGTLALTLDQSFQSVALNGTSLALTTGSYAVGQLVSTGAATRLTLDGRIGAIQFGAGNDMLTLLAGAQVGGTVDGGAGADTLVLDGGGMGSLGSAQVVNVETAVKQGSGSWTLTGTTAASPTAIAIDAGTLNVAGGNAIADGATVTIAAGAALGLQANETIDALAGTGSVGLGANTLTLGAGNGSGTFAGVAAGAGGFAKVGTGTETLSGANVYTGPTTVSAGRLALGASNAVAPVSSLTVAGGATFDLAGYAQSVGTIAGAGTIALGAGTLTVGGGNVDSTFAGTVSGSGSLTKTGGGALNLTGASTYTGPTTINAGRIAVNGSIASAVTVNGGGVLGGNGTVASVVINSGGTLAPGNSIGTMTVAGSVAFAAGSVYQVEANAAGMADRVNAGGTISIAGGAVQVLAATGSYSPLTSYTILTAAGGLSGRFASVSSNLAFLTPYLGYSANAVTLQLGRNDISFASQATGPNGAAVATAVATRGLGDPIYNAILVQTAAGAGGALAQLSGEIHATIPTLLVDGDRRVRDAVLDHDRAASGGGPELWLQSLGTSIRSRAQGQFASLHSTRIGLVGGLSYGVGDIRIGIDGGYMADRLVVGSLASRAEIDSKLVGGSIGWAPPGGRFAVRGGISHAWHRLDTTRIIATSGLAGPYRAASQAQTTQAFGEAAFALLDGPLAVSPFVRYAHVWERADALGETGGPAALSVGRERRQGDFGAAGVRVSGRRAIGDTVAIEPNLSVAYLHDWGRLDSRRSATFGGTGAAFAIVGDRLGRDNLDANGGIDLVVRDLIRLGVSGFITRSAQWRDDGGKASVSIRF